MHQLTQSLQTVLWQVTMNGVAALKSVPPFRYSGLRGHHPIRRQRESNPRHLIAIASALLMVAMIGCASVPANEQPASPSPNWPGPHENLNSVLWVQTSVEYASIAEQAYRQAREALEDALADSSWTASLEQMEKGGYAGLPPAVVLDVDETVLDNSAYQARLILDRAAYNTESWNEWVREEAASAVPGAREFTRHADSLGIRVIYLTNRLEVVEDATRSNLRALDLPITERGDDVVLTRGEREKWAGSDKTVRREYLSDRYRLLLLIGDNVGDFITLEDVPPSARRQAMRAYSGYWGAKWIMLPNPQYGSWEEAVIRYDFSAPADVQLRRKMGSLDARRAEPVNLPR